jgi:hypothetical protein
LDKVQSELAVPLLLPNEANKLLPGEPAMGALVVDHRDINRFREFDIKIIESFARIAAVAIKRYNTPAHPVFVTDPRPEHDCDIFVALKFLPPKRRQWVECCIREATRQAAQCLGLPVPPDRKNKNFVPDYRCQGNPYSEPNASKPSNPSLCFKRVGSDAECTQTADDNYTLGLRVRSADAISNIPNAIWTYIARCDLMIADMTGHSINVFYEVGLAHGLNKPVILVSDQPDKDSPADLGGILIIDYVYNPDDDDDHRRLDEAGFVKRLSESIQKYLRLYSLRYIGERPQTN